MLQPATPEGLAGYGGRGTIPTEGLRDEGPTQYDILARDRRTKNMLIESEAGLRED